MRYVAGSLSVLSVAGSLLSFASSPSVLSVAGSLSVLAVAGSLSVLSVASSLLPAICWQLSVAGSLLPLSVGALFCSLAVSAPLVSSPEDEDKRGVLWESEVEVCEREQHQEYCIVSSACEPSCVFGLEIRTEWDSQLVGLAVSALLWKHCRSGSFTEPLLGCNYGFDAKIVFGRTQNFR